MEFSKECVSIFVGDLTAEQVARLGPAIKQVQDWLNLKMRTGRFSFGLAVDLARHVVMNILNVFAIYDEIVALENSQQKVVGAKGAQRFKEKPLAGLSYKHYFDVNFLIENLKIEVGHEKTIEKFMTPRNGQIMTEEMINELTHEIVIKSFDRRSADGRLTGEWLIFEETEEGNYYLTLACHKEGECRKEGDEIIYKRIMHYPEVDTEIGRRRTEGA